MQIGNVTLTKSFIPKRIVGLVAGYGAGYIAASVITSNVPEPETRRGRIAFFVAKNVIAYAAYDTMEKYTDCLIDDYLMVFKALWHESQARMAEAEGA